MAPYKCAIRPSGATMLLHLLLSCLIPSSFATFHHRRRASSPCPPSLQGADEVAFLNITAFREEPLEDLPMLAVLEAASRRVFVPLTVRFLIRSPRAQGHTLFGMPTEHGQPFMMIA